MEKSNSKKFFSECRKKFCGRRFLKKLQSTVRRKFTIDKKIKKGFRDFPNRYTVSGTEQFAKCVTFRSACYSVKIKIYDLQKS